MKKSNRKDAETLVISLTTEQSLSLAIELLSLYHDNEFLNNKFENYIYYCKNFVSKKPNSIDQIVIFETYKLKIVNDIIVTISQK